MDQCHGCAGFVPKGLDRCPNCDRACRPALASRLGHAALAGTAMMTLMACYGGPMMWMLEDDLEASPVLLDATHPTLARVAEFSLTQPALEESAVHEMYNRVTITPVEPGTEVVVSIGMGDGPPAETTLSLVEPTTVTSCDRVGSLFPDESCTWLLEQGFTACTTETCTKATSLEITLVSGQALVEQVVTIDVEGSDVDMPEGAAASVRWLP